MCCSGVILTFLLTVGMSSTINVLATNAHFSSACNVDSNWNRHNVDVALKDWIESIKIQKPLTSPKVTFFDANSTRLKFVGNVDEEDIAEGPFWASRGYSTASSFTNGFLYGHLGNNITFIFPDMKTVMHGRFRNSVMIAARESRITAERCRRNIKEIKVARPKEEAPVLRYQRATEFKFSGDPTIVDPYERRTVFIRDIPGKGQGIFVKRAIKKGEHIAYYAGFIQNVTESPMFFRNQTEDEMFIVHQNLIVLRDEIQINLPVEYWELHRFRATLSHKCNHAFNHTNAEFNHPFHPRFGVIRGLEATRDIRKGEEVLVDYGYGVDSLVPKWYYDAYMEEVGELPEEIRQEYAKKFGQIESKKKNKR